VCKSTFPTFFTQSDLQKQKKNNFPLFPLISRILHIFIMHMEERATSKDFFLCVIGSVKKQQNNNKTLQFFIVCVQVEMAVVTADD
jgi:hypothetical protein